jgi:acetyltransferase-like isoleucine patch superfamily enzyme
MALSSPNIMTDCDTNVWNAHESARPSGEGMNRNPEVEVAGFVVEKSSSPKRSFGGLVRRIYRGVFRRITGAIFKSAYQLLTLIPYFRFVKGTAGTQNPCLLRFWFWQKIIGINRKAYWPVHFSSRINQPENILVGIDSAPGYEPGCYIQGIGPVLIGNHTQFAANVGVISANHDLSDLRKHSSAPGVQIGSYCWLGMGVVVLPGVTLGDFTIVGANTVVTRSFSKGHCVIAGSPARKIRDLPREDCKRFQVDAPYHGYITKDRFAIYRKKFLRV